jgi:cysteine desulfurase/selenocysteine lyase
VSFEKTTYNELPHKFEAGTPHISGGIALATAIQYVNEIGFDFIQTQEKALLQYAMKRMQEIPGIRFIGQAKEKASVISFLMQDIHPYDVGTLLDKMGIAVRTGHHCTEPLMRFFDIPGTVRASFAFYNTQEEIDTFVNALKRIQLMFA